MWPRFSARWCRLGNTAVSLSRYATTPGVAAPLTIAQKTHSAGLMIAAVYLDSREWKRRGSRKRRGYFTQSPQRAEAGAPTLRQGCEAVGAALRAAWNERRCANEWRPSHRPFVRAPPLDPCAGPQGRLPPPDKRCEIASVFSSALPLESLVPRLGLTKYRGDQKIVAIDSAAKFRTSVGRTPR